MSTNCPKTSKLKKKPKTFLSKGTTHEKNYMEGLNTKNKNIQGGGSSQTIILNFLFI